MIKMPVRWYNPLRPEDEGMRSLEGKYVGGAWEEPELSTNHQAGSRSPANGDAPHNFPATNEGVVQVLRVRGVNLTVDTSGRGPVPPRHGGRMGRVSREVFLTFQRMSFTPSRYLFAFKTVTNFCY